jgi:hypothetical protein
MGKCPFTPAESQVVGSWAWVTAEALGMKSTKRMPTQGLNSGMKTVRAAKPQSLTLAKRLHTLLNHLLVQILQVPHGTQFSAAYVPLLSRSASKSLSLLRNRVVKLHGES